MLQPVPHSLQYGAKRLSIARLSFAMSLVPQVMLTWQLGLWELTLLGILTGAECARKAIKGQNSTASGALEVQDVAPGLRLKTALSAARRVTVLGTVTNV